MNESLEINFNHEWMRKFPWMSIMIVPILNLKTYIKISAEMRALSSLPSTPQKGDVSLTRSQSSSAKVKRRSRSKSPFRSFRWKRSSATNGDQSDEEEGIHFWLITLKNESKRSLWTQVIHYHWVIRKNRMLFVFSFSEFVNFNCDSSLFCSIGAIYRKMNPYTEKLRFPAIQETFFTMILSILIVGWILILRYLFRSTKSIRRRWSHWRYFDEETWMGKYNKESI